VKEQKGFKKLKRRWFTIAIFFTVVIFGSVHPCYAQDATVRGKLMRQGPAGSYPAVGVQVSVHPAEGGGGARTSAPSVTGADGMYYLSNIPVGNYILEVRTAPNKPPISYPIHVKTPYTDIPQILLP
jgi:hypothetical protein